MPYGRGKKDNTYAQLVWSIDAPKTVWMAIAVSLANQQMGGDYPDQDAVTQNIMAEWHTLYENGIVPQRPRKVE